METRQFGKTDMKVGLLGFGAAEIGHEKAAVETVDRLLNEALDAGLNVIDTAECYLQSEEMIGQTVSQRRNDYYLFTKCGHPESWSSPDWRSDSLVASIERSLRRMRTDRVDLVQLHSCSEEELKKGDAIAGLQRAREKGYTRYIGYSGDSAAAAYAVNCGAFDVLQTSISIADQEAIDLTLPAARERGMGVIAKRPIANASWRYADGPTNNYHLTYWQRLQKLQYDFARPGSKTAASIALRFTAAVPGVHTLIVGSTKPGRWQENAALLSAGPLPAAEFEAIRARWRAVADETWIGQT